MPCEHRAPGGREHLASKPGLPERLILFDSLAMVSRRILDESVVEAIQIIPHATRRINRFYAIEQSDNLETMTWNEVFPSTPGTGNPMMADLPIDGVNRGFWRLRVDP